MKRLALGLALACSQAPQLPWRGALGPLDARKYGKDVLAGAVSWARGDTEGLAPSEREVYLKALDGLLRGGEGPVRELLRLAFRHGFGPEALGALGLRLDEGEIRALLAGE